MIYIFIYHVDWRRHIDSFECVHLFKFATSLRRWLYKSFMCGLSLVVSYAEWQTDTTANLVWAQTLVRLITNKEILPRSNLGPIPEKTTLKSHTRTSYQEQKNVLSESCLSHVWSCVCKWRPKRKHAALVNYVRLISLYCNSWSHLNNAIHSKRRCVPKVVSKLERVKCS